jgi:hypothetical protein
MDSAHQVAEAVISKLYDKMRMGRHQTVGNDSGVVNQRRLPQKAEICGPAIIHIQIISPVMKSGDDMKQSAVHV